MCSLFWAQVEIQVYFFYNIHIFGHLFLWLTIQTLKYRLNKRQIRIVNRILIHEKLKRSSLWLYSFFHQSYLTLLNTLQPLIEPQNSTLEIQP